jgi:hypothetical protein
MNGAWVGVLILWVVLLLLVYKHVDHVADDDVHVRMERSAT